MSTQDEVYTRTVLHGFMLKPLFSSEAALKGGDEHETHSDPNGFTRAAFGRVDGANVQIGW
jgi:hypothetical protein